jgi:hypothetical protein
MKSGINTSKKTIHIWCAEEKEYLAKVTPGHHYSEIKELMNGKFNFDFTIDQIKNAINRYKLNTGFSGQFSKGHTPKNKGVKGVVYEGCKKTWFKKGNEPVNHRPVRSERINVYGYTEVKVAEPNKWKLKQQLVWEEHNGPIPKGHVIVFGDRDKQNFNIDNLILISKKQLLVLNRNNLIKENTDSTKTGIIIADIYMKINEVKKR